MLYRKLRTLRSIVGLLTHKSDKVGKCIMASVHTICIFGIMRVMLLWMLLLLTAITGCRPRDFRRPRRRTMLVVHRARTNWMRYQATACIMLEENCLRRKMISKGVKRNKTNVSVPSLVRDWLTATSLEAGWPDVYLCRDSESPLWFPPSWSLGLKMTEKLLPTSGGDAQGSDLQLDCDRTNGDPATERCMDRGSTTSTKIKSIKGYKKEKWVTVLTTVTTW